MIDEEAGTQGDQRAWPSSEWQCPPAPAPTRPATPLLCCPHNLLPSPTPSNPTQPGQPRPPPEPVPGVGPVEEETEAPQAHSLIKTRAAEVVGLGLASLSLTLNPS